MTITVPLRLTGMQGCFVLSAPSAASAAAVTSASAVAASAGGAAAYPVGRRVFTHEYIAALSEPRQAAVHVSSRGHRGALFVLCRLGIRYAYRDYQRDDHAADVPDVDVHLRRDGIVRPQVRAVVVTAA